MKRREAIKRARGGGKCNGHHRSVATDADAGGKINCDRNEIEVRVVCAAHCEVFVRKHATLTEINSFSLTQL